MPIEVRLNGDESGSGFLIAPVGTEVFPVPIGIRTVDGSQAEVEIEVAPQGAMVEIESTRVQAGQVESRVWIHATSPSQQLNDIVLRFHVDGNIEATLSLTAISNPRVWFDGRFEVRFSTGAGFYNAPRGGDGWMWVLEDEPDFCPADPNDSVPTRVDKPGTGRVIRFQDGLLNRPHVPPIGVFVHTVEGEVGGSRVRFTSGDPAIGQAVHLGPDTYFASNRPVDPADRAAGLVPEEQHPDGFQPMANPEIHLSNLFSGSSRIGPFVDGTTESDRPREPDFRPYADGLGPLSPGEAAAYPFPPLAQFEETRLNQLVPDFVALKDAGQTDTVEFRNLRTRIGHLLPRAPADQRNQLLAEHVDVGLQVLSANPGFSWGNKETYRGIINDQLCFARATPGLIAYFSRFNSFHLLCVYFNFHTDEDRGHIYGALDPTIQPPTL